MNTIEIPDKPDTIHYMPIIPNKGISWVEWFYYYNEKLRNDGVYVDRLMGASNLTLEQLMGHDFFHFLMAITGGVAIFDHNQVAEDLATLYYQYKLQSITELSVPYEMEVLLRKDQRAASRIATIKRLHIFPNIAAILRRKLGLEDSDQIDLTRISNETEVDFFSSEEVKNEIIKIERLLSMDHSTVQALFKILDEFINVLEDDKFRVSITTNVSSFSINSFYVRGSSFDDKNFIHESALPAMEEVKRRLAVEFETLHEHSAKVLHNIYGLSPYEIASYLGYSEVQILKWIEIAKHELSSDKPRVSFELSVKRKLARMLHQQQKATAVQIAQKFGITVEMAREWLA